ncbi:hypothetical protein LEP3755_10420 [Leptolyngbya sp. NIES-3755]|nr:hypothetical protein LEP3755_10420 [Leptolyngbya sp. NIES-3755]
MGAEMGLGAGGQMQQKIYPDPYGVETWDLANCGPIVVHIVNSEQYRELTGLEPLPTPITAQAYTHYGLPWFALYDEEQGDVSATETLSRVKPILEQDSEPGEDESIDIPKSQIQPLHPPSDPS